MAVGFTRPAVVLNIPKATTPVTGLEDSERNSEGLDIAELVFVEAVELTATGDSDAAFVCNCS